MKTKYTSEIGSGTNIIELEYTDTTGASLQLSLVKCSRELASPPFVTLSRQNVMDLQDTLTKYLKATRAFNVD